ncbi:helix-turn-helix transcriptional regulator (plasmid) [Rhizobium oryzihabitans]|jgi:transcriptional regulator with XRE-family HTH domain|uniref:Helix-turn-helix transcriptional regulator n=1 Tax=Rhizobium oryzihabitans TaxID=2267833 RepID=A0A7L5BS44_9HYPH|nr:MULTISPECIES: helix-turn-helix transcriptional regulator [Rhizobium/Agrobacterium group]QIB41645.1 helix-turn-helix transcriptional regulator [Rhizobium oryzihabitans]TQN58698.1 helix-turn-helix transcriptional regulator [Agrobacterium tumefaciens]
MKNSPKTPNQIDINVGARIRLHRMRLGFSQSKLAEQLGVTFQQVQKYEKGVNRVGASRLQAIAAVFDVPVATFFEDSASTESQGEAPENDFTQFLQTPEAIALNTAFAKIENSDVRRKVLSLVKSIASQDVSS